MLCAIFSPYPPVAPRGRGGWPKLWFFYCAAIKKSSWLCGIACLIERQMPPVDETGLCCIKDSSPQIVPFATVGQLFVHPPSLTSMQESQTSASAPFPAPALHGIGCGYSWPDAPLSLVWRYSIAFSPVCQGGFLIFSARVPPRFRKKQGNFHKGMTKSPFCGMFKGKKKRTARCTLWI